MAKTGTVTSANLQAQILDPGSLQSERLFYVIAAFTMLILTAGGFRNFYLYGKAPWGEITSQIVPLIVAHGLAMSSWVILFLVQSTLILIGNRRLHMVIGPVGAVVALAIVILGVTVVPLSVRFRPEIMGHLVGQDFSWRQCSPKCFCSELLWELD